MKRVGQAVFLLIVVAAPAYAGGQQPPVVVTPEPATMGLVATGIAVIGGLTWWRKRR